MSEIKLQSEYKDLDKYKLGDLIYYCKKYTKQIHNTYGPAFFRKKWT